MASMVDFVKRLSIVFVLTFVIGLLFFSVKWMIEEERMVIGDRQNVVKSTCLMDDVYV
ncbi:MULTISPECIES: hypothetical protein [Shouchella]|uniref:Uncharacterized protein n=2 Tax=Shouchella TaxID=2893057 RepID=A0ABY7W676_9BACI|nr:MULTISPECIES: hypothetical protein [Shouchella]MED4127117.1 hypothetical protein [Shouchella miscanthi]WDF03601.1 hypothetical protein PQ477_19250 [Shouchella hunanensis]GAF24080.1 hypothetical protein JCM19047_3952 [Bacillus sp. JCM 19047]